jgi:hypothetical protein
MGDLLVNSALSGFTYQQYVGAKMLLDIRDNNYKDFKELIFEAKNESDVPNSLDDIVIFDNNNNCDYYQVKFTPNPEENFLDFDFLLNDKKNILSKMYSGYLEVEHNVKKIELTTNRKSTDEFKYILNKEKKIDLNLIDDCHLKKIKSIDNYNEDKFKNFIEKLTFKKEKNLTNLENEISNRLKNEKKNPLEFLNFIAKKSNVKKTKSDKRIITKESIEEALNPQPKFLNQKFPMSKNYKRNNDSFKDLEEGIKKTFKENKKFLLFYGSPGSGKSSLLSDFIDSSSYSVIRHHYYLSLEENNKIDRYNEYEIKKSLLFQLKKIKNDINMEKDDLYESIISISEELKYKNSKLIIILDGLDHVSRDNNNDIKPLVKIIKDLEKLDVKNLLIILGSQFIEKDLPELVINELCTNRLEIKQLSFIDFKSIFQNLKIKFHKNYHEENFYKDLYKKTKGYPLAINCVLNKITEMKLIKKEDIESLIEYKDNVNDYYDELLSNINGESKFLLKMICNKEYLIENRFLTEIYKIVKDGKKYISKIKELDCSEIKHLFNTSKLYGLMPFHDSLKVYITNKPSYKMNRKDKKALKNWLKNTAPEYIRDLFSYKEMTKKELEKEISKINLDSLAINLTKGYPLYLLKEKLEFLTVKAKEFEKWDDFYKLNNYFVKIINLYNQRTICLEKDILIDKVKNNENLIYRYLFDINLDSFNFDELVFISKILKKVEINEKKEIEKKIKDNLEDKYDLLTKNGSFEVFFEKNYPDCYDENQEIEFLSLLYLWLDLNKIQNLIEINDYVFLDILFECNLKSKIKLLIKNSSNKNLCLYLKDKRNKKDNISKIKNTIKSLNNLNINNLIDINDHINDILNIEYPKKDVFLNLIEISNKIEKTHKIKIFTDSEKEEILSQIPKKGILINDFYGEYGDNNIDEIKCFFLNKDEIVLNYFRIKLSYQFSKDCLVYDLIDSINFLLKNNSFDKEKNKKNIQIFLENINLFEDITNLKELRPALNDFDLILNNYFPYLIEDYKFKDKYSGNSYRKRIKNYNKKYNILNGIYIFEECDINAIINLREKNIDLNDILNSHDICISFVSLIKLFKTYEEKNKVNNLLKGMFEVFNESVCYLKIK